MCSQNMAYKIKFLEIALLELRRCLVKDFPYGIVYQIREYEVFIITVANLHRKPNYWIERLK